MLFFAFRYPSFRFKFTCLCRCSKVGTHVAKHSQLRSANQISGLFQKSLLSFFRCSCHCFFFISKCIFFLKGRGRRGGNWTALHDIPKRCPAPTLNCSSLHTLLLFLFLLHRCVFCLPSASQRRKSSPNANCMRQATCVAKQFCDCFSCRQFFSSSFSYSISLLCSFRWFSRSVGYRPKVFPEQWGSACNEGMKGEKSLSPFRLSPFFSKLTPVLK